MEREEKGSPQSIVSRQEDLFAVLRKVYFCKFCSEFARQPVLNVICGHLFCWGCLYRNVRRNRRKGLRQSCPLCNSHIAVSRTNSTIIRVCSGPQPGAVSCPDGVKYANMEKANVLEKKLKVKGVPRRPWFEDSSRYPSPSEFISRLLNNCCLQRICICDLLEIFCNDKKLISMECIRIVRKHICKMVEIVKGGGLWLKGREGSEAGKTISVMKKIGVLKKKAAVKMKDETHYKGKVKMIKRPVVKLQLSSQFFRGQKLGKNNHLKQQDLKCPDVQPAHLKSFSCTICHRLAYEPVVSKCGHLFCWTCLNSRGEFPTVGCPVTHLSDFIVASCTSVTPIYYSAKYEAENALLIANRLIDEQERVGDISKIRSRFNPKLASEFLESIIRLVNEEGEEIIGFLDQVASELHNYQEEREDIYKIIMGRINALMDWLVTAWSQKCQVPESDEKYGPRILIRDIVKDDEYYKMALKKLGVKEGQMSCSSDGN